MRKSGDEEETRSWRWGEKMRGEGLVDIYRELVRGIALGFAWNNEGAIGGGGKRRKGGGGRSGGPHGMLLSGVK